MVSEKKNNLEFLKKIPPMFIHSFISIEQFYREIGDKIMHLINDRKSKKVKIGETLCEIDISLNYN